MLRVVCAARGGNGGGLGLADPADRFMFAPVTAIAALVSYLPASRLPAFETGRDVPAALLATVVVFGLEDFPAALRDLFFPDFAACLPAGAFAFAPLRGFPR
ncbi:hypothetical protein [Erythrobacter sp. MTPC3]|uniref:hypothetical protein n=1 Tax=Erythrobacter sp. MTPC3 TaxID=3056564 RepID=UPI0036F195FE